ncbi:hypothetical protein C1H46_045195 [Malus baccata]|uniref:Uncharacterized protein n=1 Tax=Malus baccata TaxID=106549 RepID=A0A540K5V8_MALBA|nr:hypothetical protein C1H46_045195 [Malus baccata]
MTDFYFLVVLVLIVWHVLTLSWQNNYQMELVTQSCLKLTLAILRQESSEALRRRLYALLLSYFQYCQHMLVQDVPSTVLQFLLLDEQDGDDMDLQKVIKDATEGSELGKQMALYVLDALFCVYHEKYFLSQLQSRGFLRSCLTSTSKVQYKGGFDCMILGIISFCLARSN